MGGGEAWLEGCYHSSRTDMGPVRSLGVGERRGSQKWNLDGQKGFYSKQAVCVVGALAEAWGWGESQNPGVFGLWVSLNCVQTVCEA